MNEGRVRALQCPQCGGELPPSETGYMVCQYCGSSLVWDPGAARSPSDAPTALRGIRLTPVVCNDTEGTGMELFRMLIPVGWRMWGGCKWVLDNPGMPASINVRIFNPQGPEMFEILPNMNLTWSNDGMGRMLHPVGSRYFGAEVRAPMGIREALRTLVIPRYRGNVEGLQVTNEAPVPELPQVARSEAPLAGGTAEGGKARIRYRVQGAELEEEIYGIVEVFRTPIGGMFGRVVLDTWFVDYLFSFRAAAGRLDATGDLFKVMLNSFKFNGQWYAAYKSIIQYMGAMQVQRIRNVGEIGRMYAQVGSQIREQNLNDWYSRQATYDRLSTDWSRTIRGVDGFYDPHREEVVELPSGYGQAWANDLGEYIVTESLDYNPNLESTQHWERMEKR